MAEGPAKYEFAGPSHGSRPCRPLHAGVRLLGSTRVSGRRSGARLDATDDVAAAVALDAVGLVDGQEGGDAGAEELVGEAEALLRVLLERVVAELDDGDAGGGRGGR